MSRPLRPRSNMLVARRTLTPQEQGYTPNVRGGPFSQRGAVFKISGKPWAVQYWNDPSALTEWDLLHAISIYGPGGKYRYDSELKRYVFDVRAVPHGPRHICVLEDWIRGVRNSRIGQMIEQYRQRGAVPIPLMKDFRDERRMMAIRVGLRGPVSPYREPWDVGPQLVPARLLSPGEDAWAEAGMNADGAYSAGMYRRRW